MAEKQPVSAVPLTDNSRRRSSRRRLVMYAAGVLCAMAVVGVASIRIMLERLEARSASFQPPMTSLERQRLLPSDPVLQAPKMLENIRYGDKVGAEGGGLTPVQDTTLLKSWSRQSQNLVGSDTPLEPRHSHPPSSIR